MEEIVKYQETLFRKFTKHYVLMIEKLKNLNNDNIDILNKFNNDFRVTIDVLKELNLYLENHKTKEIENKIKEIKDMNLTIKQFMPYVIINNVIKNSF